MFAQTLSAPVLRVSSPLSPRPVPSICISPASDVFDTPALEPSSPESMSARSTHLLPPPSVSPIRRSVCPSKPTDKKGLDDSTFQGLLTANRERSTRRSVSSADRLRREVVVKAHHNKQLERRALFLSRIVAPPSPTSTETAVTPPQSPAIFHFSLPSPGLASPIELFESLTERETWIEQVDYNQKPQPTPVRESVSAPRLPSLDQITARLRPAVAADVPSIVVRSPTPVDVKSAKPRSRIPATILASTRARSKSPPVPAAAVVDAPSKLIIPASPPKSIKSVLVPQSIPALRTSADVPAKSWRDREAARKAHVQADSWRREPEPVKKENAPAAAPAPAPIRTVQGRNMVDKLRRRTSAPAELQATLQKCIPVGGF